jgi:hypothetical protein
VLPFYKNGGQRVAALCFRAARSLIMMIIPASTRTISGTTTNATNQIALGIIIDQSSEHVPCGQM